MVGRSEGQLTPELVLGTTELCEAVAVLPKEVWIIQLELLQGMDLTGHP